MKLLRDLFHLRTRKPKAVPMHAPPRFMPRAQRERPRSKRNIPRGPMDRAFEGIHCRAERDLIAKARCPTSKGTK